MIVAYDVGEEKGREKLRRFLYRMGLSRVNRSVYAGPGTSTTAQIIARRATDTVEGGDSVFIIVVREDEYQRAHVLDGKDYYIVQDRRFEVY